MIDKILGTIAAVILVGCTVMTVGFFVVVLQPDEVKTVTVKQPDVANRLFWR